MNLQNRLRLDAALAAEHGQLDDFISRQEVNRSRGRWPRQHTVKSFTPPALTSAIVEELWSDR